MLSPSMTNMYSNLQLNGWILDDPQREQLEARPTITLSTYYAYIFKQIKGLVIDSRGTFEPTRFPIGLHNKAVKHTKSVVILMVVWKNLYSEDGTIGSDET